MTREEEIKKASIEFQMANNPRCIAGGAFADFAREMNVNQSFIEGAKWADNNPSQQALAKELHRLGYGITLNGDIISKAEENKEMERYVEYQKEKFIEKACKWLKDDMLNQNAFQGRLERLEIIDGIIERFKKEMEE